MRRISFTSIFFLILLFKASIASAQAKDVPIELKSLSIEVRADLFTAVTVMNMEFYNPNSKVLDGEYNFSLNEGQVITGFALDINGFMRQGVITDKQTGRVAYENTIRRRIDPGLLEMTSGNNYRVRIYPMPATGTRRATIVISELLHVRENALHYFLPLSIPYDVKQFRVDISTSSNELMPVAAAGLLEKFSFEKKVDSFFLSHSDRNIQVKQPVAFHIPLPQTNRIICANKTANGLSFALHLKPAPNSTAAVSFSSATVFWDISSSADKRNIKKDLEFLEKFIIEKMIRDLTVVCFSNTIHDSRAFHGGSLMNGVRRYLEKQSFDGGTQLGALDCNKFNTDVYLLFSDGLSNYGNEKMNLNNKPVYCINSAATADPVALKKIAQKTGGRYVNLYSTEVNKAIEEINTVQKKLLNVQAGNTSVAVNAVLPLAFDEWLTIVGEIKDEAPQQLTFSFGDAGKVMDVERVDMSQWTGCKNNISAAAILQQFEKLVAEEDVQSLPVFARQHKLVTSFTSFIVLDNLQDYIQYGIEPPADLQEEYNKIIYTIKQRQEQRKIDEANAVINNLRTAVKLYNDRITWWAKEEPLISLKAVDQKQIEKLAISKTENVTDNEKSGTVNNAAATVGEFKSIDGNLQEVVVTAYGIQRRRDLTGSVMVVRGSEIANGSLNVAQALQGRVAGLQIVENNGMPGAATKIFIRGARSLGDDKEPLYIIDGVEVDAPTISTVSVNDIESVSVLKDIQAAMVYGSRAANGAIVITTKKGAVNRAQMKQSVTKYKDLEDVEYVMELKEAGKEVMYERYMQMKVAHIDEPAFYFDAAELLFSYGDSENAIRVLSNLAEINKENHQLLRAMGYMLETWKMYDEAINVYSKVLLIKEEEPQSYRDLALAYNSKGDYQKALDILYSALTKNWYQYEERYRGLKSLLLNEINSIISLHRDKLDLSNINEAIVKPLPVDIRIVIDWNKDETDIDLHIAEPGGEECFYKNKLTKSGGRLSEDFTQGYGPEEYQVKNAKHGNYSIRINYYGDRYQKEQVPSFVKLTIFKNFGKPNQTVSVQNVIMDGQQGIVEIGEIRW